MENDVADLYSRVASRYNSTGPPVFAHFGQRLVELATLAPGQRVLDVGAGRGAILFPAAQRVTVHGHVIGIDVAEAMVEETTATTWSSTGRSRMSPARATRISRSTF